MRFIIFFLLSILLGLTLSLLALPVAWSENPLTLKFSWNQPVYSPSQKLNATLLVANNSPQPIREFRVKLMLHSFRNKAQIIYSRTQYQAFLQPGTTKFEFSRSISSLGLSEGVYPISILLTSNKKVLLQEKSVLVVLDPKGKKSLFVALVWNIHERAHFNSEGFYLDQVVQKNCEPKGFYQQHIAVLAKHPGIKINLAFTPILAEQISDISNGYKVLENNQEREISPNSSPSRNAQRVLELYQHFLKKGQIELLSVPYAYPDLDMLTREGWEEDALLQIKEGNFILRQSFNLSEEPLGLYPPSLNLSSTSLSYGKKTGSPFILLQDALLAKNPNYWLYKVKNLGKEEINAFFADSKAAKILMTPGDPQLVIYKLIGRMAEIYLKQPEEKKILVVAPTDKNWRPSPLLIHLLYLEIEKNPWLKPLTLSEAKKKMSVKKIISLSSRKEDNQVNTYPDEIGWTREKFKLYSRITFNNNRIKKDLQKKFLILEGSDWFGNSSFSNNLVSDFLLFIEDKIRSEFSKITLPKMESVTLTSRKGKIPITVMNETGYKVKVSLSLTGKNFSFPQGNNRKVILKPQENMFTIPVVVKKRGSSKINVVLGDNGKNITSSTITVKSTFSPRAIFVVLSGGILLLSLIISIFYLRERYHRKSKSQIPSTNDQTMTK